MSNSEAADIAKVREAAWNKARRLAEVSWGEAEWGAFALRFCEAVCMLKSN